MRRQEALPTGILYGCLFFFLALGAVLFLSQPLRFAVPETDHAWALPVLSYYLEGKGPLPLLATILAPLPNYFHPPLLKAFFWLIDDLMKLPFFSFLLVGLSLHLLNSVLLGWLCRLMGLARRVALASGILYATLFIHFHGYLWFPVAQHTYSIAAILASLVFFFVTEQRIHEGRPHGLPFALSAIAAWIGSLHNSSSIALLLMVGAARSFPERERPSIYKRWLPVWGVFLLYPLITLVVAPNDTGISAVSRWAASPALKTAGLFLVGVVFLALIKGVLGIRRFPLRHPLLLVGAVWLGLALWDSRQLLLPYNAMVPWMTVLSSFLDPVRFAMQMDGTDSYYYASAQVSLFYAASVLFLVGTFVSVFWRRRSRLLVFAIWYAAVLAYLLLHRHVASSMPFRTQSRYFLYVTPVFSVVLAGAVLYGLTLFSRKAGWGRGTRDFALVLFLLAACLPNLLAIRLALFRGRLTNTYLSYDDFRTSRLIREDLDRQRVSVDPENLCVINAAPTLFDKIPWDPPVDYARIGHDNLRRFVGEAFRDRRMRSLKINETPADGRTAHLYRLEMERILDAGGQPIDRFNQLLERALAEMDAGNQTAAASRFKEAVLERPFFLNYLLGPRLRLADLLWVTGGEDLADFSELIGVRHLRWGVGPIEKTRRTYDLIRRELSNYMLCLVCLSYLEHQAGRLQQSRFWFSQIGFIEREPEVLACWLSRIPEIQGSAALRAFAEKAVDPLFFQEPLVWKKQDYSFGRFLIRLIFHRDIRSSWDNRLEAVL